MRSAVVFGLIVLLGLPAAALGQDKPAAKAAAKKGAVTLQSDSADVRNRSQRMQRRQDQLDGQTMRSICSNCDQVAPGKASRKGKAKRKRRRR